MAKITTLREFIEQSDSGKHLTRKDVSDRVQDMLVWHAIVCWPGCLADDHFISRGREACLSGIDCWLDEEDWSPRTVRGQLRRLGRAKLKDGRVITLGRHAVHELI